MRQKVFSIVALLLVAVTGAWADESSESFTTNTEASSYTGEHFKISLDDVGDGDGFFLNESKYASIEALNGEIITKVEFTCGYYEITRLRSAVGTTTYEGEVATVSGVNATSLAVNAADALQIKAVKVYYTTAPATVAITGITLSQTEATMTVGGETLTLTPTVAPNDATDKTVTWTTSDANVATVTDGVVTAVAAGTATITATATNGTADTSDDKTATCAVTVSKTVTANPGAVAGEYWSTFYNASATQGFTADANTTVYKAALNGTSSVTLTEVTYIAAEQAVILKSTTGTITLTPAATTSSDFSDNDLKGGTTVTSGYDAYTLSRGGEGSGTLGFYKYSGTTLDGSKAHLEIPKSAGSRSFIGIGDGTTAIELPTLAEDEAAEWYSLDGQRLSGKPARKGIYVRNGQKYIIR